MANGYQAKQISIEDLWTLHVQQLQVLDHKGVPYVSQKGRTSMFGAIVKAMLFVAVAGFSIVGAATSAVVVALTFQWIDLPQVGEWLGVLVQHIQYTLGGVGAVTFVATARAAAPIIWRSFLVRATEWVAQIKLDVATTPKK